MALEHQLAATYGAASLSGTLGRLAESTRRLSRWHYMGCRKKSGTTVMAGLIGQVELARLNQILRLMADTWQAKRVSTARFFQLESTLETMQEKALTMLGPRRKKTTESPGDYQRLALALDQLISGDSRSSREIAKYRISA